ncbi:hypothetical protein [Mesorhizobium sp. M4B.F.Ca.ET.058.02.1.1]|uniref:VpaChn25_0724 family phage protein n=1 Tax=Mesorhizobium sp. M4B.F.Ca.ET.058.02.1.1 TaxID=2493675 RepID=UPI000F7657A7|nr:hypothetical protein [Mesorhizobium sp. M4B.F.Ca.ET.058.02.1.1]AZO49919.1 hypothetical protein EJ073_20515 [Mesorhizobium sp. M4B.F.Ca.ET.058.02.1.1]TJX55783.1 MAG: hypothetical protein E5W21_16065 [Mesorhizobium sp.]
MRNSVEPAENVRRQHQALAILRALQRDPHDQRANERVLADFLQALALGGSHEHVRAVLLRLSEIGLVLTEMVETILVAKLTERGEAVALGNASCEGVLRAYPDCPY